jgi:glycosyltransferase involved in cell wall biosynthesis
LAPTAGSLCSGPERGENCFKLCRELPTTFVKERLGMTTKIIRKASAVVAPSRFVARIFEREVDGLQVLINPHGIRQSNIKTNNRVYKTNDNIRFGYIGNLAIHKGAHVLVSAFAAINSLGASLKIFGNGQDAYTKKLAEMSGETDVKFMGAFQPQELSNVLDQIDVLVAPSICYETYSFVVHEALASEVPVIASNLGGMAEQIEDGINGFTFQAGDVQELQTKMQIIIVNPPLLNKIKEDIRLMTFVPNIEQESYRYNQIYQLINNQA